MLLLKIFILLLADDSLTLTDRIYLYSSIKCRPPCLQHMPETVECVCIGLTDTFTMATDVICFPRKHPQRCEVQYRAVNRLDLCVCRCMRMCEKVTAN